MVIDPVWEVGMRIADSVVIVTGASSGIGLATARLLAANGAKVALVARSREKLESLASELAHSFPRPTDMSAPPEVRGMVSDVHDHYGRIDGLVNCAGRSYLGPVEEVDVESYADIFRLNVLGPFVAMQEVVPIMRRQGRGSIVNVSSPPASYVVPNIGAYSSTKSALTSLSLAARKELLKDHVVVSVVSPFMTATNLGSSALTTPHNTFCPDSGVGMPAFDRPEVPAAKILEVLRSGKAVQSARPLWYVLLAFGRSGLKARFRPAGGAA
jgi:short-subunit dehydrogenase